MPYSSIFVVIMYGNGILPIFTKIIMILYLVTIIYCESIATVFKDALYAKTCVRD